MLLRRAPQVIEVGPQPTELAFADPFEGIPFATADLLHAMDFTERRAFTELPKAVLEIATALRPEVARTALTGVLGDWYTLYVTNTGQLERISSYADGLISPDLLSANRQVIQEHSRSLSFWRKILEDRSDQDPTLAQKRGVEEIGKHVTSLYAQATTAKQRDRIVGRFESWLAAA